MNDNNIYVDRLRTLRDMVLTTPEANYYHSGYINTDPEPNVCGTVACTLGHAACRSDLFPELGIVPVRKENGEIYDIRADNGRLVASADEYFGEDAYHVIMDIGAYQDFSNEFDKKVFSEEDGMSEPTRWSNPPTWDREVTPAIVAKRIEEFVLWKHGVVL